jgi:hypothetical protein
MSFSNISHNQLAIFCQFCEQTQMDIKTILLLLLILLSLSILSACNETAIRKTTLPPSLERSLAAQQQASVKKQGQLILSSYTGSYALLIGESDYSKGWQDLENIPGELRKVEKLLTSKGFHVEKDFNLNASQLRNRFETFINQYGFDENNRLLFFFSGHGHTRNQKSYIVPIDAPNPGVDKKGILRFLQKAVDMDQIIAWMRRIEAKHVLFLFDSCFSGTEFKAKKQSKVPRQIRKATALPVRQFITAGCADEHVPTKSVFTPAFINALRYGWGDTNKDGYVTGEELGLYLWNKVQQQTPQNPQFWKIKDYKLSRGDFVFGVGKGNQVSQTVPPPSPDPTPAPVLIVDKDKDGVVDNQDKCPDNTSAEMAQGVDKRGCPLDKDQDGVADYRDSCLGTSAGVKVNKKGCPVPKPPVSKNSSHRYTDNGDGTVTDNRTEGGLIWLKNANCFGEQDWDTAMQSAANLAHGQCGLGDGSQAGMWRLPTIEEWKAMVDKRYVKPALSNAAGTRKWRKGNAFLGVRRWYWSSTTHADYPSVAWGVSIYHGKVSSNDKTFTHDVWAVRNGH